MLKNEEEIILKWITYCGHFKNNNRKKNTAVTVLGIPKVYSFQNAWFNLFILSQSEMVSWLFVCCFKMRAGPLSIICEVYRANNAAELT